MFPHMQTLKRKLCWIIASHNLISRVGRWEFNKSAQSLRVDSQKSELESQSLVSLFWKACQLHLAAITSQCLQASSTEGQGKQPGVKWTVHLLQVAS